MKTWRMAVVALAVVSVGQFAFGSSVLSAHLTNVAPGTTGYLDFPAASNVNGYVGQINWTTPQAVGSPADPVALQFSSAFAGGFDSFCIEGSQDVYLNTTQNFASIATADATSSDVSAAVALLGNRPYGEDVMGAANAALIVQFYRTYYTSATAFTGTTAQNNDDAAAFQLAIWELRYNGLSDSPNYFTGAAFSINSISGNAATIAANWLSHLNDSGQTLSNLRFYVLSDPANNNGNRAGIQDQIVVQQLTGSVPDTHPVPLPAALPAGLALLGGLAGFGLLRRRKHTD